MRVLILGGNGLLGGYLRRDFARAGHTVVASWSTHEPEPGIGTWIRLDLRRPAEVLPALRSSEPDLVVNAAGMTNVDACELDPAASNLLNTEAPDAVARAAADVGCRLVFYSTDYVFDGRHGDYREEDPTGPINAYGRHKLEAEARVRRHRPDALVLRLSVVYGRHPRRRDFVAWLRQGWEGGEVRRVVTDQSNSPTFAGFAAHATRRLVEGGVGGTCHVAGRGACSRFEFAQTAARVFGAPPRLLEPIRSADLRQAAPRPRDTSLNVERLERAMGAPPPTHEASLAELRRELETAGASPAPWGAGSGG